MNLRVDLILESERRSASAVTPKFVVRMLSLTALLVVVGLAARTAVDLMHLKSRIEALKEVNEAMAGAKSGAARLRGEFLTNLETRRELAGWVESRVSWHRQLLGLLNEVPANIQLATLQVSQTLQLGDNKIPARFVAMTLDGRAVGTDAETGVNQLKQRLMESALFSPRMKEVEVTKFEADASQAASRDDRVFQVQARLQPSLFEHEAP